MHEFSFTQSIVNAVIESIASYDVKFVQEIEIEMGEYSTFIPDQIEFCYEILTKNNDQLKDANIVFTEKKGVVECVSCEYRGTLQTIDGDIQSFSCPDCGEYLTIIEGNDCIIKQLKLMK